MSPRKLNSGSSGEDERTPEPKREDTPNPLVHGERATNIAHTMSIGMSSKKGSSLISRVYEPKAVRERERSEPNYEHEYYRADMKFSELVETLRKALLVFEDNQIKTVEAVNRQNELLESMREVLEGFDIQGLTVKLGEVLETIQLLDAHELRKVASRLLSKTEAEEKLERIRMQSRLRTQRSRERQESAGEN